MKSLVGLALSKQEINQTLPGRGEPRGFLDNVAPQILCLCELAKLRVDAGQVMPRW
jgi:hypothetical protein